MDDYIELSEGQFYKLAKLLGAPVSWIEQELGSPVLKEVLVYDAVYFYYTKGNNERNPT
jgi:hypothetical protein